MHPHSAVGNGLGFEGEATRGLHSGCVKHVHSCNKLLNLKFKNIFWGSLESSRFQPTLTQFLLLMNYGVWLLRALNILMMRADRCVCRNNSSPAVVALKMPWADRNSLQNSWWYFKHSSSYWREYFWLDVCLDAKSTGKWFSGEERFAENWGEALRSSRLHSLWERGAQKRKQF